MARTGRDANPHRSGADHPTDGELRDSETLAGFPVQESPARRVAPIEDPAVGQGERELRQQVAAAVNDVDFPATREDLLAHVAPDARNPVMGHLRALPEGAVFRSTEEVVQAFGGIE